MSDIELSPPMRLAIRQASATMTLLLPRDVNGSVVRALATRGLTEESAQGWRLTLDGLERSKEHSVQTTHACYRCGRPAVTDYTLPMGTERCERCQRARESWSEGMKARDERARNRRRDTAE